MKTSFPPTTRRRALQTVLNQKLLAAEANKRGVSAENLIKLEVDSKVAATSDDQVSAYYQGYPNEFHQPLEDVRDKISEGLMQRAVNEGKLVLLLSPPKVELTFDPARLRGDPRGDPKAPVTIVEFSDFSCSYCRGAESTMNELLGNYPGIVVPRIQTRR